MIERSINPSSFRKPASFRSLFQRPDVATVLHFIVFLRVDAQLQVSQAAAPRDSEEKRSSVTHPCWSPKRNELECTNMVHWTAASHRFSSRDAIIVVGSVLEKHFDGDFTPDQEKEIACLGCSILEHQPRLLGSGFDSRLGRLRFFPFLPKLHFQFPFPFLLSLLFLSLLFLSLSFSLRPFVCAKKTHLRIYPQKRSLSNVGHQGTKPENAAWHSTG